ncbi:hypothetical protein HPB48_026663 [Haemaphysalis longicornis]|uniref:CCHC-type domain-containing protein n=1 Tax=Haemaphysalis longicornis TaxID=44386 RepID=A0A9J6HCW1_HAELO|nr:hypothetical protein HPB48_026663 [Haemaphysalis longicornis]
MVVKGRAMDIKPNAPGTPLPSEASAALNPTQLNSPGLAKRKRTEEPSHLHEDPRVRIAADLQAHWSSAVIMPEDDNNPNLWEKVDHRRKRRTRPVQAQERVDIGSHVLTIRPKERFDVKTISAQLLYKSIAALCENLDLQKHLTIKVSEQANTVIVHTCDSAQAGKLLRLKALPIPGRALPLLVTVNQAPGRGMSRGVMHGCDKGETSASLMNALTTESVKILAARPMGKCGSALITFESSRPPRVIKYWGTLRKVIPFKITSFVCFRCHGPGHKQDICPKAVAVCPTCGTVHPESPDECPNKGKPFCAYCNEGGHLATDPRCPKREAFNRQANTTSKGRSRIRNSEWRLTATKSHQRTGKSSCTSSSLARSASLKETTEVSQDGTYASAARKATISHKPSNTITPCQGEIDQALQELALEETQAERDYASTIRHLQKQISELQKSLETVKSQFANQAKERKERRLVWQRKEEHCGKSGTTSRRMTDFSHDPLTVPPHFPNLKILPEN